MAKVHNNIVISGQQAHHQAFREAAACAASAKGEAVSIAKAQGTALNPYNAALADWFHMPEILQIDIKDWNGGAGQPIRIRVIDDMQVVQVSVVITDGNAAVLEQGTARPGETSWWTYITGAPINGNRRLEVTANPPASIVIANESL